MKQQNDNLTSQISATKKSANLISNNLHQSNSIIKDHLTTIYETISELNSDAGTEISEITADSSPTKLIEKYKNFNEKSFIEKIKLFPLDKFSLSYSSKSTTSSMSPCRRFSNRLSADFSQNQHFPMSNSHAILHFSTRLTEQEKKEIIKYEEIYFIREIFNKPHKTLQDEEGAYRGKIGDHLCFRYEIVENLGKGTFGKVFKCLDHKRKIYVAVKIINKSPRMKIQGDSEINILEKLNDSDLEDSKCIVRMLQCFEFRGHICIAFELMSYNLYHFLCNNKFKGLEKSLVKRISVQILIALRHVHSLGIIHRDLKLENILLKHENKSSIKLIDFGSATMYPKPYYSYIQSRYYRAPEVLLGCGYNNKIDIWSFGCIVVELLTGKSLFPGTSQKDMLSKIINILGMPPMSLLNRSKKKSEYFHEGVFRLDLDNNKQNNNSRKNRKDFLDDTDSLFIDFITKCLEWEPELRITAEEALKHPWIKSQTRHNEFSVAFRKNTA